MSPLNAFKDGSKLLNKISSQMSFLVKGDIYNTFMVKKQIDMLS